MKIAVLICATAVIIAVLKYATPLVHDYMQMQTLQALMGGLHTSRSPHVEMFHL